MLLAALITVILGALMVRVQMDTDPENMLSSDDPVRVLNRSLKADFGTRDMIVLGIIDDSGVLNGDTLTRTSGLIDHIKTLDGVVPEGVVSFKAAANVAEGGLSQDDVDQIAGAVGQNPLLAGLVITPDGKGLGIFIPLESKGDADGVASDIEEFLDVPGQAISGQHYLAGLPLAEETFGRDMFIQMGLLAPLAGMLVFLLMYYFFRRLTLVIAAMAVAMLSVIWTMGLLIGTGFTVHIMSSMIPIFLMPIAILDSIHILSEFFDRYPQYQDRKETLRVVYKELFTPISFTTLTTAVAFASLALAPIPPVRVFGLFVAFGVVVAWLLTMVFVPAYIMLVSEEGLKRGLAGNDQARNRLLSNGLRKMGSLVTRKAYIVPIVFVLVAAAAVPGVLQIEVNDNPVRWFKKGSDIRVATEELTRRFPGTYNASLIIEADEPGMRADPEVAANIAALQQFWSSIDVVGHTSSYVDVISRGEVSGANLGDQGHIERSLESAINSPNGGLVRSLITADYRKANLQLLMQEGDNQSMQRVVDRTEAYLDQHPLPSGIRSEWAGETYLNLVWQDKMVSGMLKAFIATFGVVLVLLVVLFRSLRWALLAMLPMSATILLVYGVLGFSGKSYDMPLAVLSTLVLGIAIDFAIHFIQRYRSLEKETQNSGVAMGRIFEEPAIAITRNAFIVALGFLPMLFASLTPYIVVGALMASIMVVSWLASMLLLPSLIALFTKGGVVMSTEPEAAGTT